MGGRCGWGAVVLGFVLLTVGGNALAAPKAPRASAVNGDANGNGQASLVLTGGNAAICYATHTDWTLCKTGTNTVTWSVVAAKGETGDPELSIHGYVQVQNAGSAPATIGNVVVNLQRKTSNKWQTVSSDIANASQGDAATTANICPGASSEGLSSFAENGGSGPLEFTDADSNTLFSIMPQVSLAPGETASVLYKAEFNNAFLAIPEGENLRIEVIVTFGNSGARGGGGASCENVDINGNGAIDNDEKYVRSVPVRTDALLPELEECNATVTLTDQEQDIHSTGTVSWTNFFTDIGGGTGVEQLDQSASRIVSIEADGGHSGGVVCNTAYLTGESSEIVILGPIDPLTGQPKQFTFVCCEGINLHACSAVRIGPDCGESGQYRTYTKESYVSVPGAALQNAYLTAFAGGFEIGNYFPGNGAAAPNGARWSATLQGLANLSAAVGGTGANGALTADTLDATSISGGVFSRQVILLTANVGWSNAGFSPAGFGELTLVDTGTSLDGQTVAQVLAAMNLALGSGAGSLPAGYTFDSLSALAANLNASFEGGTPSSWALDHLSE